MEKSNNITQNDIKVMSFMYNTETGKGLSKAKGITIEDLKSQIDFLSESKIRSTVRLLLENGFVDYGVKIGKMKTYHITNDGLNYIKSIKKVVINLNNEEE